MIVRNFTHLLVSCRSFVVPHLVMLCAGALSMMTVSKAELFLTLNYTRLPIFDRFFQYFTYIGDGWLFFAFAVLVLFFHIGKGIMAFTSFALSGLIAQVLKKIVFSDALRPAGYFGDRALIETTDGTALNVFHSFPSGHTTTAFAMFFLLTILVRQKAYGFLFFVFAFLVGYSRIYLGQHFPEDVFYGSLVGVFSTGLVWVVLSPRLQTKWANQSIVQRFR